MSQMRKQFDYIWKGFSKIGNYLSRKNKLLECSSSMWKKKIDVFLSKIFKKITKKNTFKRKYGFKMFFSSSSWLVRIVALSSLIDHFHKLILLSVSHSFLSSAIFLMIVYKIFNLILFRYLKTKWRLLNWGRWAISSTKYKSCRRIKVRQLFINDITSAQFNNW